MTPVDTPTETNSPAYQALKGRIHQDLLNRLNLDRLTRTSRAEAEPEVRAVIRDMLDRESQRMPLSFGERESLIGDVLNELFGLGPLEALLKDPEISDILVNNASQVFIERNGRIEDTGVVFRDDAAPDADHRAHRQRGRPPHRRVHADGRRPAAGRLARQRHHPAAGARRPGDVDSPLPHRPARRRRSGHPRVADGADAGVPARPRSPRGMNIIVSGGTGAGKTTLLNILSSFIGNSERVITIEDAAELTLRQRHVVRLETRPANIEGKGHVKQRHLVINALRMRPDRIIVGEVRGEEALDMLQAMNTGHDGSLTTIHANSARDALYRLDTMVAMTNLNLPERAVRQQVASAINLVDPGRRAWPTARARSRRSPRSPAWSRTSSPCRRSSRSRRRASRRTAGCIGMFRATRRPAEVLGGARHRGLPAADGHVRAPAAGGRRPVRLEDA